MQRMADKTTAGVGFDAHLGFGQKYLNRGA